MNTRAQLICAHTTPVYVALLAFGLFLLPGWLPPPSPDQTPAQFAQMILNNPWMRIGAEMCAFAAPLGVALPAAISVQLRRVEGNNHVFAYLQLGMAVIGALAILIPANIWLAISFRAGTPAEVIVPLNDFCWFLIIGGVGSAVLENLAIGLAILLGDQERGVYPRWLGYWNIWLSLALMPGVLLPFFKTGPFAWNGFLAFWVVVTAFFIWLLLNYVYTVKAIKQQARLNAAPSH